MTPPILYFDGHTIHDAWTRKDDFLATLEAIRNQKKAAVAVTQQTFSRLDRIIAFAASQISAPAPVVPKFNPATSENLTESFQRYLGDVKQILSALPVTLAKPDPALLTILSDFDGRANDVIRPNLLRLLGVLADDVFIGPIPSISTFPIDATPTAFSAGCTPPC